MHHGEGSSSLSGRPKPDVPWGGVQELSGGARRPAAAVGLTIRYPGRQSKSLKRKARPPREASLRRSGRVASLPEQPDYRDAGRNSTRQRGNAREIINRAYPTSEEINYAITKAEELANMLSSGHATFVKSMTLSYATTRNAMSVPLARTISGRVRGFFWWMRRGANLSVIPCGQFWQTLAQQGWREFALNHKLVHGDCLVFQLIERTKFNFCATALVNWRRSWQLGVSFSQVLFVDLCWTARRGS